MVTQAAFVRQIVNMLVNTKSDVIQFGVKINTNDVQHAYSRTTTRPQANSVPFKVNGIIACQASIADPIPILGEGINWVPEAGYLKEDIKLNINTCIHMINTLHIGYPCALGGLVVDGLFLSLATVNQ